MILSKFSLINFKNSSQLELEVSPFVNCFLGKNGMGKTNLLDGIYYLSNCKSFFNSVDSQNIKNDEAFFVLQGE
ncbi:MAG: AAA family ATPase, partial [Flavobacteriales bacterium]